MDKGELIIDNAGCGYFCALSIVHCQLSIDGGLKEIQR